MKLFIALGLTALLAACGGGSSTDAPAVAQVDKADTGLPALPKTLPAYKLTGEPTDPLVIIFGTGMINDFSGDLYGAQTMLKNHYQILALDLPCHSSAELAANNNSPITCWAERIKAGDDTLFLDFCSGLADVLDHLNIKSAAALAISRGGYVALTCAAYDTRIKTLVLLAPVTDLNYLTEFQVDKAPEDLFSLDQYVPYLQHRNILFRVGNDDTRISTQLVEDFSYKLPESQLEVVNEPGHYDAVTNETVLFLQANAW